MTAGRPDDPRPKVSTSKEMKVLLKGTKALVFGVVDEICPARLCRVLATIEATVLPLHVRRMCAMVSAAVLSWLRQQTVLPARRVALREASLIPRVSGRDLAPTINQPWGWRDEGRGVLS